MVPKIQCLHTHISCFCSYVAHPVHMYICLSTTRLIPWRGVGCRYMMRLGTDIKALLISNKWYQNRYPAYSLRRYGVNTGRLCMTNLTWHDYPSQMNWENNGILFLLIPHVSHIIKSLTIKFIRLNLFIHCRGYITAAPQPQYDTTLQQLHHCSSKTCYITAAPQPQEDTTLPQLRHCSSMTCYITTVYIKVP